MPEEDLRPFRLEQDLPLGVARLGAGVDDLAVEDVGDLVAVADAFERVPLAGGLLDVVLAAEALDVLPVGIAAPPVDAAAA